jgi:cytochrome c peroxidase
MRLSTRKVSAHPLTDDSVACNTCHSPRNGFEFFNRGGERNPFLDAVMKPLGLSASEIEDLVNFLGALTSDRFAELRTAELDRQHTSYLYRLAVQRETHKGSH